MTEQRPLAEALALILLTGLLLGLLTTNLLPVYLVYLLLLTAAVRMFSHTLWGHGKYLNLLSGLSFAHLPFIFTAPLYVVAHLLLPPVVASARELVFGTLLILIIWSAIMSTYVVRITERLSTGMSIAAFLLGLFATLCLFIWGAFIWSREGAQY